MKLLWDLQDGLSVLSSKPCTPFSEGREGMNVAEAIAGVLVQNAQTKDSVELCGVGASRDAYYMTNPDPEAAGAIEAIISCEAIKQGKIPPQTNMQIQDNKNINIPTQTEMQDMQYVLSNSFAFGGNNTSVIFGGVK